jgi:hypothetical protein
MLIAWLRPHTNGRFIYPWFAMSSLSILFVLAAIG